MAIYRIISLYLGLWWVLGCQAPAEERILARKSENAFVDTNVLPLQEDAIMSDASIYGDLPDSVVAELKLMDSLLLLSDAKIKKIAAEKESLETAYWLDIAALDTVSLEHWEDLKSGHFKQQQLSFDNVQSIYQSNFKQVKQLLATQGIYSFDIDLYLRAFKEEGRLELWAKPKTKKHYTLITSYPFYKGTSRLGPKRRQGDHQVPEGIYYIDYFNPESTFKISLRLNYPNAADKIRNAKEADLGGAICIHGTDASIGCLAITDLRIPNVYILATEAKDKGQQEIPIHIFPTRLTLENMEALNNRFADNKEFRDLWASMAPIYTYFEKNQALPNIEITAKGIYSLK